MTFNKILDKLILISILAVFVTSTFMPSDIIGYTALITVFLSILRRRRLVFGAAELWLLAYFMIVVISLTGSTLFALSLKGFLKTVIYLGFYVSIIPYLKDNKDKIPLIFGTIAICAGFEGIVGFLQNFAQVGEISTWQDVSSLNPEDVMTRVYGTLKPYNPNLLGGYLAACLPCLFGMSAYSLSLRKRAGVRGWLWLFFALFTSGILFATGCRGAYLAFMVIIACIALLGARYKKIYLAFAGAAVMLMSAAILSVSSLRARVLSMFAMRQDSSNSFRFNVYHSSFEMFKDNWLLGIGVGNKNFREIYGLYMKTGFDALSAYNIFLEIAVESGVFALIAFFGFLATLVKKAFLFIKNSADIKNIIFVSAALTSILAVMAHGLVDTVFFRPQIQFIFWTMTAICSAYVHFSDQ